MVLETEASTIRKVELTEEAERVESQYKATLEDHLASEKALRAKRFKVETQLASWLTKYDTDIGERHAEFEELTRWYACFICIIRNINLEYCQNSRHFFAV